MKRSSKGITRTRRKGLNAALGVGFVLVGVSGVAQANGGWDCSSLTAVTSDAATITSAASVSPPAIISGVTVSVPFCRVQGVARPSSDSEIKFEVWLPPTVGDWTRRMKVNGTGGYAGATPYARLAQDVGDGFVSAGSNMGHDGGENASWTLNHPEKVKDWGLRAHYYVATAAKAVSKAFYGKRVRYSYFEGCSNGGRQAMMMAQNYPGLFDGIVSGAPSMFYPDLLFSLLWTGKNQVPVFGQPPVVSAAKRALITQRVLEACDANDGLVDGQITNPRACTFDISTLGPSGDNSLTDQETSVVTAMYAGTHSETGQQRYTGAKLGSEADWDPNFADNGGYGKFIGHYVYGVESPPYEWRRDINFSTVYDHVKPVLTPITAAPSPDLRAFTKPRRTRHEDSRHDGDSSDHDDADDRDDDGHASHQHFAKKRGGGKLIQYHGWNDSVVPPDGSLGYFYALTQFEKLEGLPKSVFDRRVDRLTPRTVAHTAQDYVKQVQQYHRLFMLPSVGHCGGSTGPSSIGGGAPEPPKAYRDAEHHVVSAVIKWVEEGIAPESIIATRFDATGAVVRQRPVCPFPAQAAYKGSGDINAASSFKCVAHEFKTRNIDSGDILHIQNSLRQRDLLLPNR